VEVSAIILLPILANLHKSARRVESIRAAVYGSTETSNCSNTSGRVWKVDIAMLGITRVGRVVVHFNEVAIST
jgi:hypothetical protein